MVGEALNLGMTKLNTMANNLVHVTIINFSQMSLYEVYAIHNDVVTEMKVREDALIKQVRVSNNIFSKMKKIVKETKINAKTWDE